MTALATDDDSEDSEGSEDSISAALTDELDLHTFRPQECADVVEEYLYAVQEQGMTLVRVIHGKGTGTLRRIVHGVLDKHPAVARYALGAGSGSWGATLVELKPKQ
jgi:dsDNA-specific endonuclease/ATPase MutS2